MRIRGQRVVLEFSGKAGPDQHSKTGDGRDNRRGAKEGCFELSLLHSPPHDAAAVLKRRRSALQSRRLLTSNFLLPLADETYRSRNALGENQDEIVFLDVQNMHHLTVRKVVFMPKPHYMPETAVFTQVPTLK